MPPSSRQSAIQEWSRRISFRKAGPLIGAVLAQLALLLITVFVVVLVPSQKEDPEFVAHKKVYLPQKQLDHQMARSEFDKVASPPMAMERIQSQSMAEHALPDLPALPESEFDATANSLDTMTSSKQWRTADLASLAGEWSYSSDSHSFFGIEDNGRRIVIAFDVSNSVIRKAERNGVPVSRIQEETIRLIQGLNANSALGVVQFVRRFETFEDEMLTATRDVRDRAVRWVREEFHTSGYSPSSWQRIETPEGPVLDGIQAVMQTIFEWEPHVIFLLSDGGFGRNHPTRQQRIDLHELEDDIETLQSKLPERARIHFVGFEMREERRRGLRGIVRRFRGEFREF